LRRGSETGGGRRERGKKKGREQSAREGEASEEDEEICFATIKNLDFSKPAKLASS